MSDLHQRYLQLALEHELMMQAFRHLDDDKVNNDPELLAWYEEFTKMKDRMYRLAYDLGIPFEMGGKATAGDYMAVWSQVCHHFESEGNRRVVKVR